MAQGPVYSHTEYSYFNRLTVILRRACSKMFISLPLIQRLIAVTEEISVFPYWQLKEPFIATSFIIYSKPTIETLQKPCCKVSVINCFVHLWAA